MKDETRDIRLPVIEVARRLGCTRQHVYNLINAGTLAAVRLGRVKGMRIPESELRRFLEQCSTLNE